MIADYLSRTDQERSAIGLPEAGFWDVYKAQFSSFAESDHTLVSAWTNLQLQGKDPTFGDSLSLAEFSGSELGSDSPIIEKEEWEVSEHVRPDLQWREGMTEDQAAYAALISDKKQRVRGLMERASGTKALSASVLAALTVGLIDPLNWVALSAPARAVAITRLSGRLGKVGAAAAIGATEATIANIVAEPIFQGTAAHSQQRRDALMVATNIAVGASLGAGIGILGQSLSRFRPDDHDAMLSKAVEDQSEGLPVDTASAVGTRQDATEAARELLATVEGDPNAAALSGNAAALMRLVTGQGSDKDPRAYAAMVLDAYAAPGFRRNANQNFVVQQLHLSPEAQEAVRISTIPAFQRSADEKLTLKEFMAGGESVSLSRKLEGLKERRSALAEKKGEDHPDTIALDGEILGVEGRLDQLKAPKLEPSFFAASREPQQLPDEVQQSAKIFDEIQAERHRPVDGVDRVSDEDLAAIKGRMAERESNGELTPIAKAVIDENQATIKGADSRAQAWIDGAACLTGGN
jgi:hypothetical protein